MSCQCNDVVVEKKLGAIACSSTGRLIEQDIARAGCEEDQIIEMRGVCTAEKIGNIDPGDTWTQIFIPEVLCIPPQKPDVEQVMKISSKVEIMSTRVIKTPVPDPATTENFEGTLLTGRKLIIEGILRQKIIYTADVPEQSVHSAHFDVPFSAFIVVPLTVATTPPTDTLSVPYKVEPCIEDIFVCRVSKRQIFKNVTLFIKATPLVCL